MLEDVLKRGKSTILLTMMYLSKNCAEKRIFSFAFFLTAGSLIGHIFQKVNKL